MKVEGKPYRSIWLNKNRWSVDIIDQTLLPHQFKIRTLENVESAAEAIATMRVRGAPLIGATAAYGVALAMHEDPSDESLTNACRSLIKTRPTASNLRWAVERMRGVLAEWEPEKRKSLAYRAASEICDEDVATNDAIGDNGLNLIQDLWANRAANRRTFHILTHCNAGWLATVDWGTALAPIFKAHDAGIPVHVWVDETRPRNQGASLTSWELKAHGISHDVIVDNAGGHLMQRGKVDMLLTGTDRTTRSGDVCNKIGTYLKALAARDNRVPFYVALPGPTIDWSISDGISGIPIEERDGSEVSTISGRLENGEVASVQLLPDQVSVRNFAFDVTPARLVTGLITERGVCAASEEGLQFLYPEQVRESA